MSRLSDFDKKKVADEFESIKNGKFTEKDRNTVLDNIGEILNKSSFGPLARFFDDIKTMCYMVKAWADKEYTGIPVNTIGMIILTLVYVFSPIDVVPDFIPVLGLLDDAAMVGLCLAALRSDINDFRQWAKNRGKLLD